MRILKYPLNLNGSTIIQAPIIQALSVGAQRKHIYGGDIQEDIMLWASVADDYNSSITHAFYSAFTGEDAPTGTFIGTVLLYNGSLVVHVYQVN